MAPRVETAGPGNASKANGFALGIAGTFRFVFSTRWGFMFDSVRRMRTSAFPNSLRMLRNDRLASTLAYFVVLYLIRRCPH